MTWHRTEALKRVAAMSEAEKDHVAGMVLALVRSLAETRPSLPRPEPTGVTVPPELRPYVSHRSDTRKAG